MRNDELKHYGVKGMKWRNHKYVVRDGNNGDYGYDYGNNGNAYNKSGSGANTYRAPKLTPVQQRNSRRRQLKKVTLSPNGSYNKSSSGVRSTSNNRKPVQQQFGVIGKQKIYDAANTGRMKRKDRQKYNRAPSTNKTSAGARNAYKPTPKINRSPRTDRRVTQNISGDRKLSSMEIAANKARNADNSTAKKNRQTRQKSKLSAEVRAKTLREALGKVGRSAATNSPMGRRKLRNQSGQAARDTMGRAVSKGKHTAKGAHELSSQYKRNKRGVETALSLGNARKAAKDAASTLNKNSKKAAPKSVKKKSAANKRKRQIENAKKWVNSKLNDAGNFVNARKKDAGKFVNSVKKEAESAYNSITNPNKRTVYKSRKPITKRNTKTGRLEIVGWKKGKTYTTKKNNGYERTFGKGSNEWIKKKKQTKFSRDLNTALIDDYVDTSTKKKKKKKK